MSSPRVTAQYFAIAMSCLTQVAFAMQLPQPLAMQKTAHAESTANAEALAFKNKACKLLEELLAFKDDRMFKEFGFAIGGPYNRWLKNVEILRESMPMALRDTIPISVRTVPSDLIQVGMDYMREGETEFIRIRLPEIEEAIDYAGYKAQKSNTKLKFRIWSDTTGKFKTTAALIAKSGGDVTLRKKTGETIRVPIAKLSDADLRFLNREADPGN